MNIFILKKLAKDSQEMLELILFFFKRKLFFLKTAMLLSFFFKVRNHSVTLFK